MATKKTHNEDFELTNLPIEAQDPEIRKEDFVLTQQNKKVHDQKFQTRPTTFLKDSLKRFSKNKSSVVATGILGALLLLAIVVPIADRNDVSKSHPEIIYLEPKLFNAGTGFWDGTKSWSNIPVDVGEDPTGENKEENWWPNPERFTKSAVTKKKFSDLTYTSEASSYGRDGFIQTGYYSDIPDSEEYTEFKTQPMSYDFSIEENHYLSVFDVYDQNKLAKVDDLSDKAPNNYTLGECALYFSYLGSGETKEYVEIVSYNNAHSIGSELSELAEPKLNISEKIKTELTKKGVTQTTFKQASFQVRVKNELKHQNTCVLIRGIEFTTDSTNKSFVEQFTSPSFSDSTNCILRESKVESKTNYKYWSASKYGNKLLYKSKVYYCSFVYDSYEAKLGNKYDKMFAATNLDTWDSKGWMVWSCYTKPNAAGEWYVIPELFECTIIDKDKCPLVKPLEIEDVYVDQSDGEVYYVKAEYTQYKMYGYSSMPIFLFGTDKTGRDMFKYVFEGLRTSLLLGILTTLVCFLFGLLWGSISGYFGGTTDLVMERFTDILSGVPWIVVMTLVIIHMGSNFLTFAIALCLTGWIGTAATTRTQFYRFRGREYVLASRTLGASDARLIAKHILPNAMGTIITSAVLMVPSVIFSEATISYLGLGLKNLSSLGVILSNNQSELTTNSYLLIFPSVIIALLMISFNLFGNGLRDAVNPSLKGEDE